MTALQAPDLTPVPVTLITGFLGAGKTSLLNHLLHYSQGQRIAVLVNDFGAINIDAKLVQSRDRDVISLENGCICCSLSDGLLVAVANLLRKSPRPERIVVETSGVSDPIEIAHVLGDPELQRFAPLDGIVTVVDAQAVMDLTGESLHLAHRQVCSADLVLLNCVDCVDSRGLQAAKDWVRNVLPSARIVETTHSAVPPDVVFGLDATLGMPHRASSEESRYSRDAHTVFETITVETSTPLPVQSLYSLLAAMPPSVLRVKGIVNLVERPGLKCIVQATGQRAMLTIGEAWGTDASSSQLVIIGLRGWQANTAPAWWDAFHRLMIRH